jgi:hypothetical protein
MSPKGNRHEVLKVAIALRWGKLCPEGFAAAQETGLRLSEHMYVEPEFIVSDAPLDSLRCAGRTCC